MQLIEGALTVNGQTLKRGDGAAITEEDRLTFAATEDAHFLFFDLN